jgi:hypothetical protein
VDRRLLVMSVTRLSDGVCVACVDEHNTWVRPTRDKTPGWRQLDARDLRDARGQVVVKVGHLVDWPVGPPAPQGVHVEDVLVTRSPPRLAATLTHEELLRRCGDLCKLDLADFLRSGRRSLGLFKPVGVDRILFSAEGKGGIAARIQFCHGMLWNDFSVTDLRWRALGRRELARWGQRQLSWSEDDLLRELKLRICYLVVGRGQAWSGREPHRLAGQHWPFIITVVTDVPLPTEIDYASL